MLSNDEEELHTLSLQTFADSRMFVRIFNDGMRLVEDTAQYLDGPGRREQRTLPHKAALLYAGESMRVTTRLMQAASWLLVQRAVHDGEMAPEEATAARYRLGPRGICMGHGGEGVADLPSDLKSLLDRSEALYRRIARLDDALFSHAEETSGARARIAMLHRAFGSQCA